MERDDDASGRPGRWQYAPEIVLIEPLSADRCLAVAEPYEQALVSTEAISHEDDIRTASLRTVVWADHLKGQWGRDRLSFGVLESGCHKTLSVRVPRIHRMR
jgi:hypothetical protein